jgi:hypothetical protein
LNLGFLIRSDWPKKDQQASNYWPKIEAEALKRREAVLHPRSTTMTHQLRFRADCQLDLQSSSKARLEQVKVRHGEVIEAQVRPYVEETEEGPVEFADLQLGSDGTFMAVRMEHFEFV